jgi:hypothetical protein
MVFVAHNFSLAQEAIFFGIFGFVATHGEYAIFNPVLTFA